MMALIRCYECGKQISDKAFSCPDCGAPMFMPMNKQSDLKSYIVYFNKFANMGCYKRHRIKACHFVEKIYGCYEPIAFYINTDRPCILFDGISRASADFIYSFLSPMGCNLDIRVSNCKTINKELDARIKDSMILKCPRCNSTAITTGTKGYGLVRGFLGSNKTVNRCGQCGYSWEP